MYLQFKNIMKKLIYRENLNIQLNPKAKYSLLGNI